MNLQKLENLIRQRSKLPTNQRKLDEYGLDRIDLVVNKKKLASVYHQLEKTNQNKLIKLIGGKFFNETKQYIEQL